MVRAKAVLSNATPKITFLDVVLGTMDQRPSTVSVEC